MRFVSEKVFGLFLALAFFVLDFALMFDTPFGVRVMRRFALLLSCLVFSRIYIGYNVDAAHDLDRAELYTTFQCHLYDLCQQCFKDSLYSILLQSLAKYCQGRMIGSFLINCRTHKILRWHVLVEIHSHLTFGEIVQMGDQGHLEYMGWIKGWTSIDATTLIAKE